MRSRLLSCLLAVAMTAPLSAAGQPATRPPKSDAKTDEARELFIKGAALYDQGQYERAEAAFLASWSLKRHYQIAGNLGRCEMKLGKFRNAAEHLAFFLKELPPSVNPEERKRAQALFDEARAKVAAVAIQVNIEGAEVRVDGQVIGAAPLAAEAYVDPGKRTIEATRNGYQDAREVIEATAGASASVNLKLLPLAAASEPSKGPGVIDSAVVSTGPNRAVLIAGGVAAGAALVAGVVLTVASNGKARQEETRREALVQSDGPAACTGVMVPAGCQGLRDAINAKDLLGSAAGWSFIGAGVIGAGTLIYGLVASRGRPTSGSFLVPIITGQGGALAVGGRW